MNYPQIIEIIGRSEQGITRPFICRAEDDCIYFVKGSYAGRRSLVHEWLVGCLAEKFGLPVVPFKILAVPPEIFAHGDFDGALKKDLGEGAVFGSNKRVCSEITVSTANLVDEKTKRDIVVFDWWVQNLDRTLSIHGGNPNLLWDNSVEQVWVFDHNLAFDYNFNEAEFLETHIFAAELKQVASDFVSQDEYAKRLFSALDVWQKAVADLPDLWQTIDAEQTVPLCFDFTKAAEILNRCTDKSFWNLSRK